MADMSSTLECPVCSVEFTDPKLLNCNHIVCGPCIVSWLRKAGPNGGCPLCRSSIFPSLLSSSQDDLQAVVDDLPTDLSMVTRVKSFQLLNSGQVCMSCDNTTTAATSVCLQCSMKLCQACSQTHRKFPVMKNHVLEPLDNLTVECLNRVSRTICKSHNDRPAELYCCSHQELMCSLCFHLSHRLCSEVKTIEEAATERRKMQKLEAERLREKEAAMRTQIRKCRERFADMRGKAKEAFDGLQRCIEKRREEVNALIQAEEDKVMVPLAQLDQVRAATMSQAGVLDDQVESASDDDLLDMEKVMTSRLKQLEQQTASAVVMQDPADIQCDPQELTMLKTAIAALSTRKAPHSLTKLKIQPRKDGGYGGPVSQWREQQQRVVSPLQEDPLPKFQDILDRLTTENFNELVVQALDLQIDTEEHLVNRINLIYEKPKVMSTDKGRETTSRGVLLTKCQRKCEEDSTTAEDLRDEKKELDIALADDASQERTNLFEKVLEIAPSRSIGNIHLIGMQFRLNWPTERDMHDCIFKLHDDSMECLTSLLGIVGPDRDHPKAKGQMDHDFVELEEMTSDMTMQQGEPGEDGGPTGASGYAGTQGSKNKDTSGLSSHVKHGIVSIIDRRKNNWGKHNADKQEKPAKKEEPAAQLPARHPGQELSVAHGGARPKVRNHSGNPSHYKPHLQAAGAVYRISPSQAQRPIGMGDGPKSRRRQLLSLTDPNTGEDITEKVFKPMSREKLDRSMLESQAHHKDKDKKREKQQTAVFIDTPMALSLITAHHRMVMETIRAVSSSPKSAECRRPCATVPMDNEADSAN